MTKALRCAVYTRKSSEEGLDQAFNSLDAQREACAAYVQSQAGEGWTLNSRTYDDGGFSGGNMERPGLKALMADIAAGRVDVVVVYKVDRLTRSLNDFARIVEVFDGHGVSFVSVTQAFNTTSSMGRLTLNVLLSFAQFEREVTGERIRDKISASKAKGMWMGGVLPLGYDVPTDQKTRSLTLNPGEAVLVREIFEQYLKLGSVLRLRAWLNAAGHRSKVWTTLDGRQVGGRLFSNGALFYLLKNPVYVGRIPHRDKSYPASHPPIIEQTLFDAVQVKLAEQSQRRSVSRQPCVEAPLRGRIVDPQGRLMSPTFTRRRGKTIYRYYVSADGGARVGLDGRAELRRVSAAIIERLVSQRLEVLFPHEAGRLPDRSQLRRVQVLEDAVRIFLAARAITTAGGLDAAIAKLEKLAGPAEAVSADPAHRDGVVWTIPAQLKVWGGRTQLLAPNGSTARHAARHDRTLISALQDAHRVLQTHRIHARATVDDLQAATCPTSAYQRRLCRLAFLAPDIQQSILEGRQPALINLARLIGDELPFSWPGQREKFGFPAVA